MIYIYSFFQNSIGTFAIMTLFLLSKGFDMKQVVIISSATSMSTMLSSIPVGIFIDKVGTKKPMIITHLLEIFYCFILIFSKNYLIVLFGSLMNGVCTSMSTSIVFYKISYCGTDDMLKYNKYASKNMCMCNLSTLMLVPLYGYLLKYYPNIVCLPMLISSTVCLIMAIILPKIENKTVNKKHIKFKNIFNLKTLNYGKIFKSNVFQLILFSGFTISCNRILITYYPKLMLDRGVDSSIQSLYMTLVNIFVLVFTLYYSKFNNRFGNKELLLTTMFTLISAITSLNNSKYIIILSLYLVYISGFLIEVVVNRNIVKNTDNNQNLILSIKNMFKNIFHIILCQWIVFRNYNITKTIIFLIIFQVVICLPQVLYLLAVINKEECDIITENV